MVQLSRNPYEPEDCIIHLTIAGVRFILDDASYPFFHPQILLTVGSLTAMPPFTFRRRSHLTPCRSSDVRRRRRGRPTLERLEDRTVLDAVTWTGADAPADPDWTDPNNWSPHVPGGGDDVFFTGSVNGQTVPADSIDNLSLVLRSLTADSTYGNGSGSINVVRGVNLEITGGLTFNSGSIGGNGRVNLDIPSVNDVESGNIVVGAAGWSNDGVLTLGPEAGSPAAGPTPLAITNGSIAFAGGTFQNLGTITQTSATVNGPTNCNVVNAPGAVYDIESDGTVGNGSGTLTNHGTFEKSAGTGTSTGGQLLCQRRGDNRRPVRHPCLVVRLQLRAGQYLREYLDVPAGGRRGHRHRGDRHRHPRRHSDGLGCGPGGRQRRQRAHPGDRRRDPRRGHAQLPRGPVPGHRRRWRAPFVVGNVSGGTAVLTNDGFVTLDTTAGSISVGVGASGGPLTVDNEGTITQTGTAGVELGQGDIVNERGAVYDLQSDGTITGSTGTLTNQGTLEKSAGTGISTVASAFVNDGGTIDAGSGTARAFARQQPHGGPDLPEHHDVRPGGRHGHRPGRRHRDSGRHLDRLGCGHGDRSARGTLRSATRPIRRQRLNFPSGLFQFVGSGGGSPGINGNSTNGTAVLTNLGFVTFDTTAASLELGSLGGPLTFYNQGTITQTGASGVELGQANIVNQPGALYDIESDGTVTTTAPGSDAALTNMGTLLKAAGAGTATIQVLANQGTVAVQSGTLSITTDANNIAGNTLVGGTWNVAAGAALIFSSGADLITNDGTSP